MEVQHSKNRSRSPVLHGRAILIIVILAVLSATMLITAGGCKDEAVGTPEEIIEKAIAAQSELKSVELRMENEMELKSPVETRSATISYKGSFERPDKWSLVIQANGVKSEVIVIGEDTYIKTPGSTTWEKRKADVLGGDSSSDDIINLDYLDAASDIRLVDQKGGKYHLEFNLDVAANAALFNVAGVTEFDRSLVKGKKAQMEMWIQKETYYVEEARLSFSRSPSGEESGGIRVKMEMRFSDFNEPVSIEPPM